MKQTAVLFNMNRGPWPALVMLATAVFMFSCSRSQGEGLFPAPEWLLTGNQRFSVYYNDPGVDQFTMGDSQLDVRLVEMLDRAEERVDIAVYNFNRRSIVEAILRTQERGVEVRMVGDQTDSQFGAGYQDIFRSPIPLSVGNPSAIQHNKFAIVDDRFVFLSTANFSDTDLMRNNNNIVIVESPSIADAYVKEFEQMFYGRYGGRKIPVHGDLVTHHTVNGIPVEVYFSPYGGEPSIQRLIELADNAQSEIHFMIFAFTHDELAAALIRAARRGVRVRGVHDFTFIRGVSMVAPQLYSAGQRMNEMIEVREDGNENTAIPGIRASGGKLHTKTIVFDRSIVSTGSFNWSNNAVNNNDENMVIIHSRRMADEIMSQWEEVRTVSRDIRTNNQIREARGETANFGDVVISEVMWAGSYSNDGGGCGFDSSFDGSDEYVELRNMTNQDIDISHWMLSWERAGRVSYFPFPDGHNWFPANVNNRHSSGRIILPANGYFLLRDLNQAVDDADMRISGVKNFGISSASMELRLYDLTGNLIDRAGDGRRPFAGFRDSDARKTYSMERFFHPDTGKPFPGDRQGSWYTANHWEGSGMIRTGYENCTVGTPNYTGSSSPASPTNAYGGVHNLTNHPVNARSTGPNSAEIQMRWAMVDTPTVVHAGTDENPCAPGGCPVSLHPDDPSILRISTNTQVTGTGGTAKYTVEVEGGSGNDYTDATGSWAVGGNISFTGHGLPRARVQIETVAPRQSSLTSGACSGDPNNCHYVEIKALSDGVIGGLGLYAYTYENRDPFLLREFSDVSVRTGDRIRVSLHDGTASEDNLAEHERRSGLEASFRLGDRNGNNTWNTYSQEITTFGSSDAILYLQWRGDERPVDLMCYSNQDGTMAFNLEYGFRRVYDWGPTVYNFGVFPIMNVNNLEVERRCTAAPGSTSNWILNRVSNNRGPGDFQLTIL